MFNLQNYAEIFPGVTQMKKGVWIRQATLWMENYLKLFLQRPNLKKNLIKYGWFHFILCSIFQHLSQCSIEKGFLADLRRSLDSLNLHKKPDFDTRSFNIMKHELMKKLLNQMQIIHKTLQMNKSILSWKRHLIYNTVNSNFFCQFRDKKTKILVWILNLIF